MIFDDKFMINAMKRIDELQQETIEKAKKIEGASEYIKKKLELYDKDEEIRNNLKIIHLREMKISKEFFGTK